MALTFTPFVVGNVIQPNTVGVIEGINNAFNALYLLFGFTGSPGQLTSPNFGNGGINASQVNAGTTGGGLSNVSGNVSSATGFEFIDPSLTVTGPAGGVLYSGTASGIGQYVFCGTAGDAVALTGNPTTGVFAFSPLAPLSTFQVKTSTTAYLFTFGSVLSGYTKAGAQPSNKLHGVYGSVQTDLSGTASVTLLNDAVFTNGNYRVFWAPQDQIGNNGTSSAVAYVTYISGSQFTIKYWVTFAVRTINWIAIGY
jgi:hypothetical protein